MDSSAADTSVDVLALYPEAVRFHVCETMVEAIHAKMEAGSAAFAAVTETPRHVAFALEVVGAALSLPWTAAGDRVVAKAVDVTLRWLASGALRPEDDLRALLGLGRLFLCARGDGGDAGRPHVGAVPVLRISINLFGDGIRRDAFFTTSNPLRRRPALRPGGARRRAARRQRAARFFCGEDARFRRSGAASAASRSTRSARAPRTGCPARRAARAPSRPSSSTSRTASTASTPSSRTNSRRISSTPSSTRASCRCVVALASTPRRAIVGRGRGPERRPLRRRVLGAARGAVPGLGRSPAGRRGLGALVLAARLRRRRGRRRPRRRRRRARLRRRAALRTRRLRLGPHPPRARRGPPAPAPTDG